MENIKAIETLYKGYRFRSRLEARWAVFFDALGIDWEYEHEGYDLGKYGWYLPDFWLPTFCGGMHAEVKQKNDKFEKSKSFCLVTGLPIWLCEGTPAIRVYDVLMRMTSAFSLEKKEWYELPPEEWEVISQNGIPNADQAQGADRMFWMPGYEELDGTIDIFYQDCLGETFLFAVECARSARFEHGEQG